MSDVTNSSDNGKKKVTAVCLKIQMRHNLQGVFFTTGYIWLGHLCL